MIRDFSVMKSNLAHVLRIAVVLILLGLSGVAFGQASGVSVESGVDRQQAYMGDRLKYSLTLTTDSSTIVDTIPIGKTLGDFEVKRRSASLAHPAPGKLAHHYEYVITAYQTGKLWIPQLKLRFVSADGDTSEAATDSVAVDILSLASGDSLADIRGLKPPIYFGTRFPWLYVIVGVVLVGGIVLWLMKSRKKRPEEAAHVKPVDNRPPWVIAEAELKALRESGLLEQAQYKEFYLRLTDIIRTYLEPRYGIDALDRTTFELKRDLRAINLDKSDFDLLFDLFDGADLVKFAKLVPSMSEAEADFQKGWSFVQMTGKRKVEEVAAQ